MAGLALDCAGPFFILVTGGQMRKPARRCWPCVGSRVSGDRSKGGQRRIAGVVALSGSHFGRSRGALARALAARAWNGCEFCGANPSVLAWCVGMQAQA